MLCDLGVGLGYEELVSEQHFRKLVVPDESQVPMSPNDVHTHDAPASWICSSAVSRPQPLIAWARQKRSFGARRASGDVHQSKVSSVPDISKC